MNTGQGRSGIKWWEHLWYAAVTLFLLGIGVLLVVIAAIGWGFGKMRKAAWVSAVVLVLLLAVAGWGVWQYYRTVDLGERTVTLIVKQGESFSQVARELAQEGVVSSDLVLKIPARWTGADKKLVPGRYDFTGPISAADVLRRLAEGDFLRVRITVPEGSTVRETAALLSHRLELDGQRVLALGNDTAFLREVGKPCLEGYLFPETYFFPWGIDEREALRTMVGMFDRMTEGLWAEEMTLGLSRHEIVTLASIIESETPLPKERGLVASVYVNRLRSGWKLDADPTVIYGLGGLNRPLYRRDLKLDTPYNTYLHRGLPPTPINSPGIASIRAALRPDSSDYYFFVATNTGGHYFSRTLAEHDRARRAAKRAAKQP